MSLLFKLAAMPLAALALASNGPEITGARTLVNYPLVHQVICSKSKGTAFRVGPRQFLSVEHVTQNSGCTIDGVAFTHVDDEGKDFSRIDIDLPREGALKVSCEGIHAGEYYWSVGYAWGAPFQTGVLLYATYAKASNGFRVMIGPYTVIPGMSGGPVFNGKGEVVATINAYIPGGDTSFVRDLRDTSICKDGA